MVKRSNVNLGSKLTVRLTVADRRYLEKLAASSRTSLAGAVALIIEDARAGPGGMTAEEVSFSKAVVSRLRQGFVPLRVGT